MMLAIEIHSTDEKMPETYRKVIVEGGIAEWNGVNWITMTGFDSGRVIDWPVRWWTSMIYSEKENAVV